VLESGLAGVSVGLVLAGMVVGALVSALVATGVEQVAYRPLRRRHAPKLAFLISAIGASFFIQTLAGKEFGYGVNIFPGEVFEPGKVMFTLFGSPIHTIAVVSIVARHRHARGGGSHRAGHPPRSRYSCRPRKTPKPRRSWGSISTAPSPSPSSWAARSLERPDSSTRSRVAIVQNAGTEIGIYAFTAAVLGGIGNLRGAALGGLFIGLFGSFSIPFAFEGNVQWTEIYTFLILVLVLIIRPTGILGEKSGRTA